MFDLPGPDKLALELSRPAIEAERRLRAGCRDEDVYDLVLAATGSEEAAAAAATERAAARLRARETPGV